MRATTGILLIYEQGVQFDRIVVVEWHEIQLVRIDSYNINFKLHRSEHSKQH